MPSAACQRFCQPSPLPVRLCVCACAGKHHGKRCGGVRVEVAARGAEKRGQLLLFVTRIVTTSEVREGRMPSGPDGRIQPQGGAA